MTKPAVILASGSQIRARLLAAAGVSFDARSPGVDEDAIKRYGLREGRDLESIALELATAKARAIDGGPDALVIGSDQILEFRGDPFDKPPSMDAARQRLLHLQGATHTLVNAAVVLRAGVVIYANLARPVLRMRSLTQREIDLYLEEAGPAVLSSVGAYQVEALGQRLFDSIEGDYTAVLGLCMPPLLAFLRDAGVIEY